MPALQVVFNYLYIAYCLLRFRFRLAAALTFRLGNVVGVFGKSRRIEAGLQHVRHRMHVPQFAAFHAEQVHIRRAAAAARSSSAKSTEHRYSAEYFIDYVPPVDDIDSAWHPDLCRIPWKCRTVGFRRFSARRGIRSAFNTDAWNSPRQYELSADG